MIKIIKTDDVNAPFIFCDICGKQIEDISMAVAVFRIGMNNGDSVEVEYAHKGDCQNKAEAHIDFFERWGGWTELHTYLEDLMHNMKIRH